MKCLETGKSFASRWTLVWISRGEELVVLLQVLRNARPFVGDVLLISWIKLLLSDGDDVPHVDELSLHDEQRSHKLGRVLAVLKSQKKSKIWNSSLIHLL